MRPRQAGRLGLLAAGVGIDFGVEDEHVDVAVAREHVIEAAVTDVVGPAVAAQQPDTFRDEIIGQYLQPPRLGRVHCGQLLAQCLHAFALCRDPRLTRLVGGKQLLHQGVAQFHPEPLDQRASGGHVAIDSQAKAEAEFCVVFEQRIGPGRTASVAIRVYGVVGRLPP